MSVVTSGVRVGIAGARALVPRARTALTSAGRGARAVATAPATKLSAGIAAVGAASGFAVDAVRKGFYNPRTESFPAALAGGIGTEDAAEERRVREQEAPLAAEFFTSTRFLLFAVAAVVLVAIVARRR